MCLERSRECDFISGGEIRLEMIWRIWKTAGFRPVPNRIQYPVQPHKVLLLFLNPGRKLQEERQAGETTNPGDHKPRKCRATKLNKALHHHRQTLEQKRTLTVIAR